MKRNLFYFKTLLVPRSKHSSVIKTDQLIIYRAKVAVCSYIRTKRTNTLREQTG
jgi:hypothetical protein